MVTRGKKKFMFFFGKNRHALLTRGSEVTHGFIPYKMSTELCVVFQEIQVILA